MSTVLRISRVPSVAALLRRALEPTVTHFTAFLVLADLTAILAATGVGLLVPAGAIGFDGSETVRLVPPPGIGVAALAFVALWMAMLALAGAYGSSGMAPLRRQYRRLGAATALLVGALSLLTLLLRLPSTTSVLLVTPTLGLLLLFLGRFAGRAVLLRLRANGHCLSHAVTLFPHMLTEDLLTRIRRHPELGVALVGTVPQAGDGTPGALATDPRAVIDAMTTQGADTLLVPTDTAGLDAEALRLIRWELDSHALRLALVPPLTGVSEDRLSLEAGTDMALLRITPASYTGPRYVGKRAFDLLASSIGILLLTPVWLGLAALVRLNDGGPVLFLQQRVGLNGTTFPMVKFRTMVTDAESALEGVRGTDPGEAGNEVMFKMREDPRVTRPGRVLRRLSLDELPQLFNVWLGHMSLVGPRPCLPREAALHEEPVHRRFLVRPGITGLWQTSGRSNLSWEDTVRLDLYYVENWTMRRDLTILLRTVRAVLSADGAY